MMPTTNGGKNVQTYLKPVSFERLLVSKVCPKVKRFVFFKQEPGLFFKKNPKLFGQAGSLVEEVVQI